MSARDPESSPWFRVPLIVCAALAAWLVLTQWIDDYVARQESVVEVRP
jgi:hypothetical protein